MHSSVPVRRSERVKNIDTTILKDSGSSIIQQEKHERSRRLIIPKEKNCQQVLFNTEPIETQYACSTFIPKDILVHRKPRNPRKVMPKKMKCQQTSLITKPTETVCALSSFKQERDKFLYCRKSPRTRGESSNRRGECTQIRENNHDIVRDGEVNHPIWSLDSGSIRVSRDNFGVTDGLVAYISEKAGVEVVDAVKVRPSLLEAQVLSRLDVWPTDHDNALLPEIQNRPIGRSASPDQESCGSMAQAIRPEFCTRTETTSVHEHLSANYRESPSAVRNVPADSESIGASILEMAKNFNDPTCAEDISSPHAVEPKYARTLSAILVKHGDITRDCLIKCTKTLSCVLESICASVQDLENMRFVDLRRVHLESMKSVISDAEVMKLDVKWLRKRYEELKDAIDQLPELLNLKAKRKQVNECAANKKRIISRKKDEMREVMLKMEAEIEKLESEAAEFTQEKEKLSSEIKNVTSKCNYFSHNSLSEGLI